MKSRVIGCLSVLFWLGLAVSPSSAQVDVAGYGSSPYLFQPASNTYTWGNTMTVQFYVANYGSIPNPTNFNIAFYLTTHSTITNSDDYSFGKVTVTDTIPPGYAYGYTVSLPLPSANPFVGSPTNMYVAMWVDCDDQVDGSYSNNKNRGLGKDSAAVTVIPPVPRILATSSTVPYTNLTVGFSNVVNDGLGGAVGIQTVTVINTGGTNLTVSGVNLTGSTNFSLTSIADSAQSRFVSPASLPSTPQQIAPSGGESWVFTLQFDPTTNGALSGTLAITNSDPTTPVLSISLSGTGVAVPELALTTPASLINFGGQVDDGSGGWQTTEDILIQNNGSGSLTVNQNGASLLTGTQFRIASITSSHQGLIYLTNGPATIAANKSETWDIKITFDPLALGALNDALQILSSDPNNPTFTLPLQGQGLKAAQLVVSDAAGVISNRTETFSGVDADGPGLEQATTNITLQNSGDVPLIIPTNGLIFTNGTQYFVSNIVSSSAGVINLLTNSAQIAPDSNETWTVTLLFDPSLTNTLTDTLSIYASNMLTQTTNVAATVPVTGQGLSRASLVVSNSLCPTNPLVMDFGNHLSGTVATATLTLLNRGTQPLVINQNGFTNWDAPALTISSIVSSTGRSVDITSSDPNARTIAPKQAEIWTITVTWNVDSGTGSQFLDIASNDPQNPDTRITFAGTPVMPYITLNTPSMPLHVSAGSVYTFSWQTSYPLPTATISLYLETTPNPFTGLMPIATGLPITNGDTYAWHVSSAFSGTNYVVLALIADGGITNSDYAMGTLAVDPVADFQFLSSGTVTNASDVYQYVYNGQTYTNTNQLALGANVVNITNGTAVNQVVITRVASLSQVQAVQYNQLNQVTTTTNGNGIVTTLVYDQMGRLVERQSSNGATVTYAYNPSSQRTSMTDYTGTTSYGYDDLNRLTALTNGAGLVLTYEYDLSGRETAIVYPGGERIQYTYDNAGRLSTVSNVTRNLFFQYSYNSTSGQLTKLTRPNGIETDYSYDGMGRVTNILHKFTSSDALVANYNYILDAMGKAKLLTTTLPGGVQLGPFAPTYYKLEQYSYDYLDRLTNVVYGDNGAIIPSALSVSYTYDGNGNRLTKTTRTNNAVTEVRYYNYGNENRLLAVTNQNGLVLDSYAYDSAGNRIQKVATNDIVQYSYDERNLMTGFVDNTNQISYTYNGDAERVTSIVNGALTQFVIDPAQNPFQVVQQRNGSGTITESYSFGTTRLATWNGTAVTFELTDRLGSVRFVTDTSGNVLQAYNYDAFGANR
jgi:YD repeat-containing protein